MNQGCYLVDTEVRLGQLNLHQFGDENEHVVIDVCGVGLKAFSSSGTQIEDEPSSELRDGSMYQFDINVLRGIEVKVSRSDFKNGYVISCNYNYLLTPMRLVAPSEITKGIGLIEFNKYKFSLELNEDVNFNESNRVFRIVGLRVVKRPLFRRIPQYQVDNAIARVARRSSKYYNQKILEEIKSRF